MKEGYYLSETGNLQIWYPEGSEHEGFQTMEIFKDERWQKVLFSIEDVRTLLKVYDFEFLGDL
jgi:hypothetical protein